MRFGFRKYKFCMKFTNTIKNHISDKKTKSRVFYIEYMVSGPVGIIRLWIKTPETYSIDEVSKLLIEIYYIDMIDLLKS